MHRGSLSVFGIVFSVRALFCVSVFALLVGCGKYGPPVAPELVSPAEVRQLSVVGAHDGVMFAWMSPTVDQRGKELKGIDGYKILRKSITKESDISDKSVAFSEISDIPDFSIKERQKLREAAVAEGRPAHRIQSPGELMRFSFKDSKVTPGQRYLYKVVPVNQGGVEGRVVQMFDVRFRGASTEVVAVRFNELDSFDSGQFL